MAQIPKIKKGRRLSPNRYAYQTVKRYWNRRPSLTARDKKTLNLIYLLATQIA
jgi:hypothetical protein